MGVAEVLTEPGSRSTCQVMATGWLKGLEVTAGGAGIVSRAGAVAGAGG